MRSLRALLIYLFSGLRRLLSVFALGFLAVMVLSPDARSRLMSVIPQMTSWVNIDELVSPRLSKVTISGIKNASSTDVARALELQTGDNLLDFDYEAARKRIENLSWVAQAKVGLSLPSEIRVDIVERVPAWLWQYQNEFTLLDLQGVSIIKVQSDAPYPVLVGAGADRSTGEALTLLPANGWLADNLVAMVRVGERRWDFLLRDGMRIMAPEKDAQTALAQIRSLMPVIVREYGSRVVIDLRLKSRVGITPLVPEDQLVAGDTRHLGRGGI